MELSQNVNCLNKRTKCSTGHEGTGAEQEHSSTESQPRRNVDGRMTDEQLMGKDLEGSGHGLVYVVLHVILKGLCKRASRRRCKLFLQVQKASTTRSWSVELSCTTAPCSL